MTILTKKSVVVTYTARKASVQLARYILRGSWRIKDNDEWLLFMKGINMLFRVGPRNSGKTTRMIDWMKDGVGKGETRICLCINEHEAERLRREFCFKFNLEDNQFVTLNTLLRVRGRRKVVIGIDNLDIILKILLGETIGLVTATGELDHEENKSPTAN